MLSIGVNARAERDGRVDGHDPAAAIFVGGKLEAAVEEERFSALRHASGAFPIAAVEWCLRKVGAEPQEVDEVFVGWDPSLQADAPPRAEEIVRRSLFPTLIGTRARRPEVTFVRHHLAHAAGAFYSSSFDEAAVLIIDGAGEQESVSAYDCADGRTRLLWTLPIGASLGFFYAALTEYVGLGPHNEGKTMALAAYGSSTSDLRSPLAGELSTTPATLEGNDAIVESWIRYFERSFGRQRNPDLLEFDDEAGRFVRRRGNALAYSDAAASGQARLEDDILHLARRALSETGRAALAISGGVGLNCVANGRLERDLPGVSIHIQPAANDAGVAFGAAAAGIERRGGEVEHLTPDSVYSGPAYERGAIIDLLRRIGAPHRLTGDYIYEAASLLAQGAVVGLFEGGAEFGPRALGGRSLLADPAVPGIKSRLNAIKRREQWRPLGLSLLRSDSEDVFGRDLQAPYMLTSHPVSERMRKLVEGAVHVDGSTRPQIIEGEGTAPRAMREILTVRRKSGRRGGVLNTSLNLNAPIVRTPAAALNLLFGSEIDALVIEGVIVHKAGGVPVTLFGGKGPDE